MLKRARFVFEVRDLWPESAVVAGVLRRGLFVRLIEQVERFLYARADTLVALSAGIQAGIIERGGPAGKIVLVPNGMDDWMVDMPIEPIANFPLDTEQHFVCTYIGALGRWNSLETLLEAAKILEGSRVRFLIVGDGDHRDELRRHAARLGLTNTVFHGPVPKNQVLGYLAASDVCVLCTWPHPFLGTVLQNKIFDYMAASRPIVAAVHGELAALIETADCGWVVSPGAPDALARICLDLASTDAVRASTQRRQWSRVRRASLPAIAPGRPRARGGTSTMHRSPDSTAHYSLEP